ncbi:MAG TPA: hypothetical protein PKH07_19125, partial [bacterium]|nr:hypothetical protein [bacterium]
QAIDLLQQLLTVIPGQRDASMLLAETLAGKGMVGEAARIFIALGEQARSEKKLLEAVEYFKRVAVLTPDDAEIQLLLGSVLCDVGNREAAAEHWSVGLDRLLHAQDWEGLFAALCPMRMLAEHNIQLSRKITASLEEIVSKWPQANKKPEVLKVWMDARLNLLALLGNDIARVDVAQEIRALAARLVTEEEACAQAWEWLGRASETTDPKKASSLLKAAALYGAQGEGERTRSLCDEVRALSCVSLQDRETLVALLFGAGEAEQAQREQLALAEGLLDAGEVEAATAQFEKSLEHNPNQPLVLERLFDLYVQRSLTEKARQVAQMLSEHWEQEKNILQAIAWQKRVLLPGREEKDEQQLMVTALTGLVKAELDCRIGQVLRLASLFESAGMHLEKKATI